MTAVPPAGGTGPSMNLKALWTPRSIAIVGASERAGHGANAVRNLVESKFAGQVFPVNPKYSLINGLPCYPSLADLPASPECVIVAVRDEAVLSVLDEAGRRGSKAAVVFSSGFAEAGRRGVDLQDRLRDIATGHGMAVCGPNCMGIVNLVDRIPLYVAPLPPLRRNAAADTAIVAQSGSVSSLFLYHTDRIACTYVVSSGNQAVTDCVDYLRYFTEDARTRVIGFFVEGIPRPGDFYAALEDTHRRGKAVVICKTGRSARSNQATLAHTGALAQPYEVLAALFRQAGATVTDDLDEMVETLVAFSGARRLSGVPKFGVVTASGGQNALILDLADELGLQFGDLSPTTRSALSQQLPDFATAENPLDMTGALLFAPDAYRRALSTIATDENLNAMVKVQELPRPTVKPADRRRFWHTLEAFARVPQETGKPAFFITPIMMPSDKSVVRLFKPAGVTVLKGLRTGLAALAHVQRRAIAQAALCLSGAAAPAPPDSRQNDVALPSGAAVLHEGMAKDLLAGAGFPIVKFARARDLEGVLDAARAIGYPVVLKVDSPQILHKSDVGGVRLDLQDEAALERAFAGLRRDVGDRVSDVELSSYLVEQMVPRGTEVILGYKSDPEFGPLLVLGIGGTLVEVIRGAAIRRLPVSEFDAEQMLDDLPVLKRVLQGVRGAAPGDVGSLTRLVLRLSRFCLRNERAIRELDLNPVVVLPDGVRIVDALIVTKDGA